jgi:hypothetical protein
MREPQILTEYNGGEVKYSFDQVEGFEEFHYLGLYTPNNKSFRKKVYCLCESDFLRLLDRWNSMSSEWKYSSD